MISLMMIHLIKGFNTQPPEGGCIIPTGAVLIVDVSTLSRPKAAGLEFSIRIIRYSFNTQPPEGGWTVNATVEAQVSSFNTQPPEGG